MRKEKPRGSGQISADEAHASGVSPVRSPRVDPPQGGATHR